MLLDDLELSGFVYCLFCCPVYALHRFIILDWFVLALCLPGHSEDYYSSELAMTLQIQGFCDTGPAEARA